MSWTEVAGFLTGALFVLLVVRQHIADFAVGNAGNLSTLDSVDDPWRTRAQPRND